MNLVHLSKMNMGLGNNMALPENTNFDEMSQGIDRITQILQQQSSPVQSSPYMPSAVNLPANIMNALAYSSYDPGNGRGGGFMKNVQDYQSNDQNQQIAQQKNILAAYDMKLKMGDAKTKALDDKINLFTGGDPEGKAMFLQALHDDPESIDPTNSFQVMTKLASIKKQTGYESPDLKLSNEKKQLENKVLESTVVKNETTGKTMNPADAAKVSMANNALNDVNQVKKMLTGPDGSIDLTTLMTANMNVPGTKGRQVRNLMKNAIEAQLRLESGAAVPDSEVERALDRFMPSALDDQETKKQKLDQLSTLLSGNLSLTGAKVATKPIQSSMPIEDSRKLGEKTYVKINGKWHEQ